MEQKNFKEISITELAKKAGVSRMAFYRNYNQKEDIITSYLNELFDEYSKQILGWQKIDNYESLLLYFSYFRKHDRLITNLIHSNLENLILERGIEYFNWLSHQSISKKSYSPIKKRYTIEFIAGGLFKVLLEWAKSGMKESNEDIAKLVCDIINT